MSVLAKLLCENNSFQLKGNAITLDILNLNTNIFNRLLTVKYRKIMIYSVNKM